MTPEDFDTVFESFHSSAVRLEALPLYDAGEERARLKAAREGTPRPVRSVRTSPWLARMAVTTVAGKSWSRVRILSEPPTDYERDELVSYVESQATGERISVVRRSEVTDSGPDFWLFDTGHPDARAAVMRYGAGGRFEGADLVTDPGVLAGLATRLKTVQAQAVPLNVYLASAID